MKKGRKDKKKKLEKPNTSVRIKQKRTIKILIENGGKSVSGAMREAGYSLGYSKNPQKLTASPTFQELLDEAMPDSDLLAVHKSLLKSKRVERMIVNKKTPDADIKEMLEEANCTLKKVYEFMGDKHVMFWAPNDKARSDALDMGYKLKGTYAKTKIELTTPIHELSDEELDQLMRDEAAKIAK